MASHHVLGAAKFKKPPSRFYIPIPNGIDHRADRHVVGKEFVRIDIHLILLSESSNPGHFGNAGNRL